MQEKKILRSATDSVSRVAEARSGVATDMNTDLVRAQANRLLKPGSPSSTMKKVGIALIVGTPDPITAVPGVALVAASLATRRKDPTKLQDLATETRKILRDIQGLSL